MPTTRSTSQRVEDPASQEEAQAAPPAAPQAAPLAAPAAPLAVPAAPQAASLASQQSASQAVVAEQVYHYGDDESSATQRELKTLRLLHSSMQHKLIQLLEEVTANPITASTHNVKFQYLNDLKAKQNAIFEKVIALAPADMELDFAEDEAYSKICIQLDTLIARGTPSATSVPVNPVVIAPSHHLNIPMPTFDGTYSQWPKFKSMFSDIVQQSGASDAVKLHHLNKALIGNASGILNASIIAGNNFVSAWQILEDRYKNPRVIVDGHISGLLQMKPLARESARGLRDLMETCKTHVDGLSYMKKEIDGTSDLIITHIMCRQCDVLDQCAPDKGEKGKVAGAKAYTSSVQVCKLCRGEQHTIAQCQDFLALSVREKQAKAQTLHLCYNCLGSGHSSLRCESKRKCRHCNRRHHTLLHIELSNDTAETENVPSTSTQSSQAGSTTSQPTESQFSPQVALSVNGEATSTVLLSTVIINIMDDQGIEHHARALLDSGSQSNFVSGRLAQLLRLPRKLVNIPLSGIGGSSNINVRHAVRATIRSRCSNDTFFVDLLVLPKPTANLPTRPVNISNWNIPAEYILADPTFNQPGSVDIILGAEMFYEFLKERRVSFGQHRSILQESKFGWIVSGNAPVETFADPTVCMTAIKDTTDEPNLRLEERETTTSEDIESNPLQWFPTIEHRVQQKPETRQVSIECNNERQHQRPISKVAAVNLTKADLDRVFGSSTVPTTLMATNVCRLKPRFVAAIIGEPPDADVLKGVSEHNPAEFPRNRLKPWRQMQQRNMWY